MCITQLAKMSIGPESNEFTIDVFDIVIQSMCTCVYYCHTCAHMCRCMYV